MALQPEAGLGPILNAVDIIVADTQQKRRNIRDDRIRKEGFDRQDAQRLQSGKIGALNKILGIKGLDPNQFQKTFDTIVDTLANPDTNIGGIDVNAREPGPPAPQRFGLTPEDVKEFPTLKGQDFLLPDFFKIQSQRTLNQRADDSGKKIKANIKEIRDNKNKTPKDSTRKDFVKNLNEFKDTLNEETKRISEKDPLAPAGRIRFKGKPGQEDRFNELQNDIKPELEKLERTVSGFRSTSVNELEKWFERGWIEKDIFQQLLDENGLTQEFIDKNNATK